jgi:hypothetical protein
MIEIAPMTLSEIWNHVMNRFNVAIDPREIGRAHV